MYRGQEANSNDCIENSKLVSGDAFGILYAVREVFGLRRLSRLIIGVNIRRDLQPVGFISDG